MHKQLVQINIILKSILFNLSLPLSTLKKQPGLLAEALQQLRTQIPHKHLLFAKPNKFNWTKELVSSCHWLYSVGGSRKRWILISPLSQPNFSLPCLARGEIKSFKVLPLSLANYSLGTGKLKVFGILLHQEYKSLVLVVSVKSTTDWIA